jgi:hypothetical protein
VREQSEKVVVILISGRPLIITEALPYADAFVAAWLPGTEGMGVADVLFGDRPSPARLPFSWPVRRNNCHLTLPTCLRMAVMRRYFPMDLA